MWRFVTGLAFSLSWVTLASAQADDVSHANKQETEWINVKSSAIRKIGYDASASRMYIDFEDSDPYYTYCHVPEELFRRFVSAHSVGSFYHQYVKGKYDC